MGFDRSYFKHMLDFLGRKVLWLLALGTTAGIGLYFVEIAFVYSLQIFLVSIGVMSRSVANFPHWLPPLSLQFVIICILSIGLARGILQWAQVTMQGAAEQYVCTLQRSRILTWTFHSQSVNSAEILTLFGERNNRTAAVINSMQGLSVSGSSALLLGISLLVMQPRLTLVMGAVLLVVMLLLRGIDRKISIAGVGVATEWIRINERLIVSIKNLLLMQIYGTQKDEERKAQKNLTDYLRFILSYHNLSGMKVAIVQFIGVALICVMIVVTQKFTVSSPGLLLSYFYLFVRFLQTVSSIVLSMASVTANRPQIEELARWWITKSFDSPRVNKEVSPAFIGAPFAQPIGWKMVNVSFSYPESTEVVIKNFNLHLKPKQALAITGHSGSGKSTILNIMLGGIEATSGTVEIITDDSATLPLQQARPRLLASIGYVGPENFLIEGSLRKNILYGLRHEPSEEQIQEALFKAECQFINTMPQGLDHILSEQGEGLSAGQKQRLSLARALLRNPKALILDEATANLDADTEARLIETFKKLKSEMTIIFVTHRQSLLQIADQQINLT